MRAKLIYEKFNIENSDLIDDIEFDTKMFLGHKFS